MSNPRETLPAKSYVYSRKSERTSWIRIANRLGLSLSEWLRGLGNKAVAESEPKPSKKDLCARCGGPWNPGMQDLYLCDTCYGLSLLETKGKCDLSGGPVDSKPGPAETPQRHPYRNESGNERKQ